MYEEILQRFSEKKAGILIGTQMIVKGHDFPNVTLVGIIAADQITLDSDFQAGERAYQLLTQFSGRAGRGTEEGEVIVQTYQPENPVLKLSLQENYLSFYREEMRYRRRLFYPPYAVMLAIQLLHTDEIYLDFVLSKVTEKLLVKGAETEGEVYGPFPATIYKIKDKFRKIIYIKHSNHDIILRLRDYFVEELRREDKRGLISYHFDLL